jgi:hypothetical protein
MPQGIKSDGKKIMKYEQAQFWKAVSEDFKVLS